MKQKNSPAILLAVLWLAAAALAQPRPLKVLVLYDMEGVTGATSSNMSSSCTRPNTRRGASR